MKKIPLLLLTGFICFTGLQAQFSRYIVQFKHKGATINTLSNPAPYLSQRAISRRIRYNISLDSTDLPVPASYISQIQNIPNVTVLNVSRWLNAVAIQTTDANALSSISTLSFVQNTSAVAARNATVTKNKFPGNGKALPNSSAKTTQTESDYFNYGAGSLAEIHLHHGEFLHNIGLRGQGMQIAMLDGGYFSYTSLKAFDSINANAQVLSTWDFVTGNASVTEDNAHGMQCFSIIGANIPGQFIGKAPKANFHLFRTEDVASEFPIEEFNWACGAERADSTGSDIISSSLGYGYQFTPPVPDYPYSDLNGDITMSARAADLAAKKGLMVFNSAGNSGTDYWHMITTPADGDSIVAVGSVNIAGIAAANSSYGPSADGRIKPDVASVGVNAMVQLPDNNIGVGSGTSFACPNMAGLSTCLWQGFPEYNNMRIIRALKEAGSIYNSPNDRIGYGIPDMRKAFSSLLAEFATSNGSVNNCTVTLIWTSKDVGAMKYEVERKAPGDAAFVKISEINPQTGNLLSVHTYQATNILTNVAAGTVAYRIRQIVDTSSTAFYAMYIDTAEITTSTACTTTATTDPDITGTKIIVAPNPASNTASLIIETNYAIANMPIAVYDMKGRLILQLQRSKAAGKILIDLPISKWSKGKYIIKVDNNQKIIGKTGFLKL
ncbi:MAG: S8 family serine peptidase [Chitinophagaceae bacterium]